MNDSLLKRHITIYSEQLRSRRLWNIFIILIFAVSFFMSSSIIDFNLSQIIDKIPIGAVSSVAHLGTSIVATSEDISSIVNVLEEFGEVRKY